MFTVISVFPKEKTLWKELDLNSGTPVPHETTLTTGPVSLFGIFGFLLGEDLSLSDFDHIISDFLIYEEVS